MDYKQILFDVNDGIALITLNRPEAMNAFTGEMAEDWTDAYRHCDENDDIKVVIVTGSGTAFCAGADMSGGGNTFDLKEDMSFSSCPVMPAWKVRKPVIAALNGHAIGLGFSLALQCDFRIAALEGKYGLLQVRRGVLADACSHWLLPRLVGMEKALELQLSGRRMSGEELCQSGLAGSCCPRDNVLATAVTMARDMAVNCSPLVMGLAKKLVWDSFAMCVEQMETLETRMLHHTMGNKDAIEGGAAYVERRIPQWSSKVSEDWPDDFSC
jgi:enoyl-CoA hydratase/carnithine racemase